MLKYKKERLRKFIKYIILTIVAIYTFLGLRLFFNSREVITYEAPKPIVEIAKPVKQPIENSLILNGYIEAESMVPVVPFVNGTIIEYYAKTGEYVEKNEVLAKLDSEPFEFQASQAKAAYLGYEKAYKRVSALWNAKAVTRQEYESISAQRDAAKAQYDLAKLQLSYATVKAPIEGTVLVAPQSVGDIGNTSQPVAVLASMDKLVVRLKVPERYFDLFSKEKDQIEVYIIRESENISSERLDAAASIDTVAPYIEAQSKNFEVKIRLDEYLDVFRPGMFIKVKLIYEKRDDLLVLPQTAKKSDGSLYVYNKSTQTVLWVNFESEIYSENFFSVPSEYKDDYFVVCGQHSLMDGQPVNVRDKE